MEIVEEAESSDFLLDDNLDEFEYSTVTFLTISLKYRKNQSLRALTLVLVLITTLFLLVTLPLLLTITNNTHTEPTPIRNVILMISDGFGPASQTLARNYYQVLNNLDYTHRLALDTILTGSSRTQSSSSLITDSAAGATAFACGIKTYNGAIGVDAFGKPCGTVLEAAKRKGLLTGLVVTSRITHATPAAFSAHVPGRDDESQIAKNQIGDYVLGKNLDLLFGGGKCFFLPKGSNGSCRTDSEDIFQRARQLGWNIGNGMEDFKSEMKLPLLNLFSSDHLPYEIDRDQTVVPSLAEMSYKALGLLHPAEKGFFMMIEGSRIDMAAHTNDAATHIHEILAYNDAISVVKKYVDENPDTILLSTSDHETGGLSVGKQVNASSYPPYRWLPQNLFSIKHSSEYIAEQLTTQTILTRENFIRDIIFNVWFGFPATQADVDYLSAPHSLLQYGTYLSSVTSLRAEVGWSTHGHSGVDVNLYSYGSKGMKGNVENIDIGNFMVDTLGLDLNSITAALNKV